MNGTHQPTSCDDHGNPELARQHHLTLALELKDGEKLQAKASDSASRKNAGYLAVETAGTTHELCLDKTTSFSHPKIGMVVVGES